LRWEFDAHLPGVLDDAGCDVLAQIAEGLARGLAGNRPCRQGLGRDGGPGLRVARCAWVNTWSTGRGCVLASPVQGRTRSGRLPFGRLLSVFLCAARSGRSGTVPVMGAAVPTCRAGRVSGRSHIIFANGPWPGRRVEQSGGPRECSVSLLLPDASVGVEEASPWLAQWGCRGWL
jgi:hypothetical protein